MNNLQKRILTSFIILPLSIFFVVKGGYFLLFFNSLVFFVANYELFSVFNKKKTILFLDLILILSLFSIYYLIRTIQLTFYFYYGLLFLCVCSDIGGYVFGKIFKWKKLTKLVPIKQLSGVLDHLYFLYFQYLLLIILPKLLHYQTFYKFFRS